MKKILICAVVLIGIASYGQATGKGVNESTINLNVNSSLEKTQGLLYLGDGIYKIKKKSFGFKGKSGLEKDIRKQIDEIAKRLGATYNVINVESFTDGKLDPNVEISFKLISADGTPMMSKDEAKKRILELKEFLDIGVITKEEFDTKAFALKKILLDN